MDHTYQVYVSWKVLKNTKYMVRYRWAVAVWFCKEGLIVNNCCLLTLPSLRSEGCLSWNLHKQGGRAGVEGILFNSGKHILFTPARYNAFRNVIHKNVKTNGNCPELNISPLYFLCHPTCVFAQSRRENSCQQQSPGIKGTCIVTKTILHKHQGLLLKASTSNFR